MDTPTAKAREQEVVQEALSRGFIEPDAVHSAGELASSLSLRSGAEEYTVLQSLCSAFLTPAQVTELQRAYPDAELWERTSRGVQRARELLEAHDTRVGTGRARGAAPPPSEPKDMELRGRVVAAYQEASRSDPYFAPHAESVLEVIEELGQGGMGVVHRVRDRRLGRMAALKLVREEVADENTILLFRREVQITARLDHPGVPAVYEAGTTASGQHFLLMRLIEGQPLSERIRDFRYMRSDRDRRLAALLEVLIKVGETIAYAHGRGVVHRDIKPDNIMVGRFGQVLVLDWGLAKVLGAEDEDGLLRHSSWADRASGEDLSDETSALLGTLGYMPPEQALAQPIDERADVFALGALLTTVLTGKPPIRGKRFMERLTRTLEHQIETPRQRNPRISPVLDRIAASALAPERKNRTQTAEEFVRQLRAFLAEEEVPGYRYTRRERLLLAVKRRPTPLIVGFLVSLLVGVGGVLGLQLSRAEREREAAEMREASAKESKAAADAVRADLQRALELLSEAEDLAHRTGDEDQVRERIIDSLKACPSRFLFRQAARICEQARMYGLACEILRASERSFPPAYRELYHLHRLTLLQGDQQGYAWTEPLTRLVDTAQRLGDTNEFTLFASGVRLQADRDLDGAIRAYSAALELNPRFAKALMNRGMCHFLARRLDQALQDLDESLRIDPQQPDVYSNRGSVKMTMGRRNSAIEDLTRAIELDPEFSNAYYNRGLVYRTVGDTERMARDWSRLLELKPDHRLAKDIRAELEKLRRR